MKTRFIPAFLSGILLFNSSPLFAHMDHSATGATGKWLHLITGSHHAPLLLLACAVVGYLLWRRERSGK